MVVKVCNLHQTVVQTPEEQVDLVVAVVVPILVDHLQVVLQTQPHKDLLEERE